MTTRHSRHKANRKELPYRDGVGVVVTNPDGLVLVGECRGFSDLWKMPQGGVEFGETPEQAARRELEEETGITQITVKRKAKKSYCYDYPDDGRYLPGYKGQKFRWFLVEAHEKLDLDPLHLAIRVVVRDLEYTRLQWVTPEEAIRLAHNEYGDPVTKQRQEMYKRVLAEFGLMEREPEPPHEKRENRKHRAGKFDPS